MPLSPLNALSPLDGRYQSKVAPLRKLFSEAALIRFRVLVEIEWLKALAQESALAEVPAFSAATLGELDALVATFSDADAQTVKAIEARTNHDVKAVEYFLREKLTTSGAVFTEPAWAKASDEGYAKTQAGLIEDAHKAGAKGLKVLKNLGLFLRERRTQKRRVRCVMRTRIGILQPRIGNDGHVIFDGLERGEDR